MKNTHCSHCGTRFENTDWPRVCVNKPACGALTWENPMPVVVILQPVMREEENGAIRLGAMIAKRAIWPQKGEWSLISGYANVGENAEDAAMREFREETSLEVMSYPRYAYSRHNDLGMMMLCFIVDEPMPYETFLQGKCCPENEELGVRWDDAPLAFPLQSEFADKWLAGEFRR